MSPKTSNKDYEVPSFCGRISLGEAIDLLDDLRKAIEEVQDHQSCFVAKTGNDRIRLTVHPDRPPFREDRTRETEDET